MNVNDMVTYARTDTNLTQPVRRSFALPDCARHLARLRPTYPNLQTRFAISDLITQVKGWDNGGNRDELRKRIPETIAKIEEAKRWL